MDAAYARPLSGRIIDNVFSLLALLTTDARTSYPWPLAREASPPASCCARGFSLEILISHSRTT